MAEEAELFGKALRARRAALGLTQREVAERVEGKTEGKDISRYERGEHLPGQDTRAALAAALETTLADLYVAATGDKPSGPTPDLLSQLSGPPDLRPRLDEIADKLDRIIEHLGIGESAGEPDLTPEAAPEIDQLERDLADGDAALPDTGATSL